MKVVSIYVRFFRSFNYDYELKFRKRQSEPPDWETTELGWFPFIKVDLEPTMTAIVGANEAGKSQLLTAVQAALTGVPIERSDFCRYSALYSVQDDIPRLPEFGVQLAVDPDRDNLSDLPELRDVTNFALYRPGARPPFLVINNRRVELDPDSLRSLQTALPKIHKLETRLAVPDNVSIAALADGDPAQGPDRKQRFALLEALGDAQVSTDPSLTKLINLFLSPPDDEANRGLAEERAAEFELARQLLIDAAGIKPPHFAELRQAIASGREGEVEAVVGSMNLSIKDNLNIQRWWSQDDNFDLRVEAREHEVAFTIRDRTGAKYSFQERSQGLRFFLSYFVQLHALSLAGNKPDILLLDEPDAYLSSVGQQDLLRVLNNFAVPEVESTPTQVLYVTHSPFLIDKNAPQRIRVLDKGSEDEGTRVVTDAANNRYEPLRSSLGAYVAETAFIGGRNLFVEGAVDQLLIAGLSTHILQHDPSAVRVLDLNAVTVVSAGGADGVPYLVYLARGRDSVKPPCVALLDGDQAGKDAERVLKRGEARRKRILQDKYIVRLDTWAEASGLIFEPGVVVQEIEDLVPLEVLHRAALNYLARFQDLGAVNIAAFTVDNIAGHLADHGGDVWTSLCAAFISAFPEEHLEKVGVAREVLQVVRLNPYLAGAGELRERFSRLIDELLGKLDLAFDEEARNRSGDRFVRAIASFQTTYKTGMPKTEARRLLRELQHAVGEGAHGDVVVTTLDRLTREFEINSAATPAVPRFSLFRQQVQELGNLERAMYQDDVQIDPAAELLAQAGSEPAQAPKAGKRSRSPKRQDLTGDTAT